MRRRLKNDFNISMRLRRYNGLLCFAPENGQVDIDHKRRIAAVGLGIMLCGHDVVGYACLLIFRGTN